MMSTSLNRSNNSKSETAGSHVIIFHPFTVILQSLCFIMLHPQENHPSPALRFLSGRRHPCECTCFRMSNLGFKMNIQMRLAQTDSTSTNLSELTVTYRSEIPTPSYTSLSPHLVFLSHFLSCRTLSRHVSVSSGIGLWGLSASKTPGWTTQAEWVVPGTIWDYTRAVRLAAHIEPGLSKKSMWNNHAACIHLTSVPLTFKLCPTLHLLA